MVSAVASISSSVGPGRGVSRTVPEIGVGVGVNAWWTTTPQNGQTAGVLSCSGVGRSRSPWWPRGQVRSWVMNGFLKLTTMAHP